MEHPLKEKVDLALENIREYLKNDGGDVRIFNITEDNIVELELLGSCESCHMSNSTMKMGIEQAILKAVPEITKVIAINGVNVK